MARRHSHLGVLRFASQRGIDRVVARWQPGQQERPAGDHVQHGMTFRVMHLHRHIGREV